MLSSQSRRLPFWLLRCAVLTGLVWLGCTPSRRYAKSPGAQALLAQAPSPTATLVNELGFEGLRSIAAKLDANQNILWAPTGFASSAYFLKLAARAQTKTEIDTYLNRHQSKRPPSNQELASFFGAHASSKHPHKWGIERMHWVRSVKSIRPEFVQSSHALLDCRTKGSDWRQDPAASMREINHWAEKSSHGLISQAIPKPIPAQAFSLFVELFFVDLAWQENFHSNPKRTMPFRRADGQVKEVSFFSGIADSVYAENAHHGFRLAALETKDPEVNVVILDPGPSRDPLAMLQRLSWKDIRNTIYKAERASISWKLPNAKLKMKRAHDLVALFDATGCKLCAGPGGDFGAMSTLANPRREIKQLSTLELSKSGIKATAVTTTMSFESAATIPSREMVLDHPFVLLIVHRSTSTVLFSAYLGDPSLGEAAAYGAAK